MQPDADPQWPSTLGQAAAVDLGQDFPRRGRRMARGGTVFDRRAEDRHEAVAQELVYETPMPVDRFGHEGEGSVEELDDLLRLPSSGVGREIADVEEQHADLADLVGELRRAIQQTIDHRGGDMLAEEIGDALARGSLREDLAELRAQPKGDEAGQSEPPRPEWTESL